MRSRLLKRHDLREKDRNISALTGAQVVSKVRVVHAGCGVNALSGLHNPDNSIYCNCRVGLISVAHQAI